MHISVQILHGIEMQAHALDARVVALRGAGAPPR
jgi:hypothetical protein